MKRELAFMLLACLMVTFYLAANCMAVKIIEIGSVSIFDCGTIVFPLTYMLGETITEVFGVKRARRLVLFTFVCQILFVFFTWLGTQLPFPAEQADIAHAYISVFTYVPRIMVASLTAFLAGEMTNVYLMSLIRQHIGGPLFVRTVVSSIIGYSLDTSIFVCIAFLGTVSTSALLSMIGIQIAAKVLIECCISTPMTYGLVHWIKTHTEP